MITLSRKGKLKAIEVDAKQADSRLLKIQNKTRKSGKIQVNFSDGTNLLVDKDTYKTGDSVLYSKGKVSKHLPLKEGMTILLTGGSHLAKTGSVKAVEGRTIVFENADGEHSTAKRHALVVGEKSPEVTIQ